MNDIATAPVSGCLAKGWAEATLGEIADINPAIEISDLPRDLPVSFVPMPAVVALTGQIDTSDIRSLSEVSKGYTRFKEGDVLFAKITPCMENGKIAIANNLSNGLGFGSTEFHVIRSLNEISNRYVFYYLLQDAFREEAEHNMKGTAGQRRVPADFLDDASIPIPPAREQERIVAKIDELFSELDAGVASLKRARALLKKYRQAVLKAAVTGELTRGWRERHKGEIRESGAELLQRILKARRDAWEAAELKKLRTKGKPPKDDRWKQKYKEPQPPDTAGLPDLPQGWVWASLPQLGEFGRGKSKHRPRNDAKLYGGDYPFIQTGVVREANGVINHFDQTYNEAGLAQSKLWPEGTMCITIAANIAETGILGFDACFPDSVVGLVPHFDMRVQCIEYFMRTVREDLDRYAPATAQKNINLEILFEVAVPLPPSTEQEAVVSETERLLSVGDALEAEIATALRRNEIMRQAILRAAFSGKLVPQDPSDEPASVLLERIRAERAANPKPARGRRLRRQPATYRQLELLR